DRDRALRRLDDLAVVRLDLDRPWRECAGPWTEDVQRVDADLARSLGERHDAVSRVCETDPRRVDGHAALEFVDADLVDAQALVERQQISLAAALAAQADTHSCLCLKSEMRSQGRLV